MNISIGIVGLPNVGKSTLFNALLKKQVANVANYPYCTIEPNVGIIEVPDERLPILAKIVKTEKIVPAAIEFYDIAGLVKGASKGEGLGNQFLAHIREVAAIVHVVRLFEDTNVAHVSDKIHPFDDIKTIQSELMLADLETLNKQKEPKTNSTKEEILKYQVITKLKQSLNADISVKDANLTPEEIKLISSLNLLTIKPVIYLFNASEEQLNNHLQTQNTINGIIRSVFPDNQSVTSIYLCAKMENEILALNENEQKDYLKQYHLDETGLNRLIKAAYKTLGLISFLTGGEKQVQAWTIKNGTLAKQAAGVIHTDFEKHFICAHVIPYQQFVKLDGWTKAYQAGKVQTVGKEYIVKDGDVVDFKIGT